MVKAVIFDLNGVFLESEYLSDRMERALGVSGEKFYRALKMVMTEAQKPEVRDSFLLWRPHLKRLGLNFKKREFFDFWFSGESLVPQLLNFTQKLRSRGIKVFILSNNFKERTGYYRQHYPQIFESIDRAYFSFETGLVKPDSRAYQKILEENDLRPEECVYFDDSQVNIQAAANFGIRAQKYEGLQATQKFLQEQGIKL